MATTTGGTTESKAEQAGDSTSLEWLARGGLIAYGVVHLLVGWLALQIAWGRPPAPAPTPPARWKRWPDNPSARCCCGWSRSAWWHSRSGRPAKPSGATATGRREAGPQAGHQRGQGRRLRRPRLSAALVALGSGSSSSQSQEQATTGVLAWPGGRVLVVAAGLVIIGVGVAGIVKGVKEVLRRGDRHLVDVPHGPHGRAAAGTGRIHRQGRGPRRRGGPAHLRHADLRPAAGSRTRRRPADHPGAAVRSSCSPRSRSDSSPSACSRSSNRDTAACDGVLRPIVVIFNPQSTGAGPQLAQELNDGPSRDRLPDIPLHLCPPNAPDTPASWPGRPRRPDIR